MNHLYYAHSYRSEDAFLVKHFADLARGTGLLPRLDPPSERGVNSAKFERSLASCDGMLVVLTRRAGGVSQHILYELSICLRARKPLLVFVEDELPEGIAPVRVLQRRFSRKSYLRQIREHHHALQLFQRYMGQPPPRYQPSTSQRLCVTAGLGGFDSSVSAAVRERGYRVATAVVDPAAAVDDRLSELIACGDLVICRADAESGAAQHVYGAVRTAFVPCIPLRFSDAPLPPSEVPKDYLVRPIGELREDAVLALIAREIDLFEEDFVDIDDQDSVRAYAELLLQHASTEGHYPEGTRSQFVKELNYVMGDQYKTGQGVVGRYARAHDNTFNQVWQEGGGVDLARLAAELDRLRAAMRKASTGNSEEDAALGQVAAAETAAKKGDGPHVLEHLASAGKWALKIAEEIGVGLTVETIKRSLGM